MLSFRSFYCVVDVCIIRPFGWYVNQMLGITLQDQWLLPQRLQSSAVCYLHGWSMLRSTSHQPLLLQCSKDTSAGRSSSVCTLRASRLLRTIVVCCLSCVNYNAKRRHCQPKCQLISAHVLAQLLPDPHRSHAGSRCEC
jgi:hypothetical protein